MEKILRSQPVCCSIIIPVLNEAGLINDTIDHLHGLAGDKETEIIVVDGDPDGGTLREISDDDVMKIRSPRGRGRQMNEGAAIGRGNILLFLHADTRLPPDALRLIATAMQKKHYVAGAFDLGIRSARPIFRLIENAASIRSRMTRIPFGDQAVFIRKDYLDAIGRFREIPLMEDVEIMQRIKKRGDKIAILHQKALTSSRRWEEEGIVYCTLRNWVLQVLYFIGISPSKLSRLYNQSLCKLPDRHYNE
jgi:rSAM/selenodomain-associated transferase 2